MENLDHDGFSLPDQKGFLLLLTVYNKACQVGQSENSGFCLPSECCCTPLLPLALFSLGNSGLYHCF